jgi:hypothetical protein
MAQAGRRIPPMIHIDAGRAARLYQVSRRLNTTQAASTAVSTKKDLVVIGTGWAGARVVRDVDPQLFNVRVIAPRNHMVFTPLLPQACTGTLELR